MNLILHVDEIFLKGNNQQLFYRHLKNNLRLLFPGISVNRVEGGIFIENFDGNERERLALIPGIANFSVAFISENKIDDIKKAIDSAIEFSEAKSFRITAERSNKKFEYTSAQLYRFYCTFCKNQGLDPSFKLRNFSSALPHRVQRVLNAKVVRKALSGNRSSVVNLVVDLSQDNPELVAA